MSAEASTESPWFVVGEDSVRHLRDGRQAFPAMLEAIAKAENEVLLEMYWVGADVVGELFREALRERAASGVRVKVIYDALGSIGLNDEWWKSLRDAGGEVHAFHTLSPLERSFDLEHVERRDHRKLLVVDHALGIAGGINLSMQWWPLDDGGQGWRDDMIAVRGPAAAELRSLFYHTWERVTGTSIPPEVSPLPGLRTRPVWVMANSTRRRRGIRREYLLRIHRATNEIDIANSYFVPDRSVRGALFRAVARGVRVRVLVPAQGDVAIVHYAVEALYEQLLVYGVELYALPGPMLHAKTAIIDREFVTIGSYNLDERSWRKNLELNVAVEDKPFAEHVATWFERDLEIAQSVDLATWRTRPFTRRGFEFIALALRKFW